jgi:hypothetical protein
MREISAALVLLRLGSAGITVLETLVHRNGVLSAPLVLGCYKLPDEIDLLVCVQSADLPSGWNAIPHGHASAAFSAAWLGSVASLALELPSVDGSRTSLSLSARSGCACWSRVAATFCRSGSACCCTASAVAV